MKAKYIIVVVVAWIVLATSITAAQEPQKLYFKLVKGHYTKSVHKTIGLIKTRREVTIYNFYLPCSCVSSGSLSFERHDNPEAVFSSEPVSRITKAAKREIKYISFEKLVALMTQHNSSFNRFYSLYFVEEESNCLYPVRAGRNFGDEGGDVVIVDSLGRVIPEWF